MGKLVHPQVYWIGYTTINKEGLDAYLRDADCEDFQKSIDEARKQGLSDGEILCSMYAKLCYKSLVLGHNANITRVRDIPDNIRGCFDSGHGSVFEHVNYNFVIRDCSRVFTHELVRHRVGVAFSQTSGRYCRGDKVDIVFDPILEPVRSQVETVQMVLEHHYNLMVKTMGLDDMKDFNKKKKITSALRRVLPNGQSNEIGFSVNLRSVRQIIQVRTGRHAEWEIRVIFGQIYNILKEKHPLIFYGAKEEMVDGLLEVSGMKLQPWEKSE